MRAAIVDAVGAGFAIQEIDLADPIGREVLVDVRASGLCHTDWTLATQDMGIIPFPALFGHEVAGVVIGVGPGVTQVRPGDHVAACIVQSCGACARCLSGRPYQCLDPAAVHRAPGQPARLTRAGSPVVQAHGLGGFAQQALVHENQLVRIPRVMPFAQASLLGCGVVTGAGAVLNSASVRPGDAVVIIGVGGVGLNAVSAARLAGAGRIVAVDVKDGSLEKARRLGATDIVNSGYTDPVEAVRDLLPSGADHAFDFVGLTQVTAQALEMLAVGGGLYLIGVARPDAQVALTLATAVLRQPRIVGVNTGSTNPRHDIPMFCQLYLDGRFALDELVSVEVSLEDIEAGYQKLAEPGVSRVVITRF